MSVGDHIWVRRLRYSHHGIAAGDGSVIHFSGEPGSKRAAAIIRSSLVNFLAGGTLRTVVYGFRNGPVEALRRAESRLGEVGYNLAFNNCEHFARWCAIGKSCSEQVRAVCHAAGGSALTGAAATGGITGVTVLGVAGVSGPGVMSALATAGGLVGGGAAIGPAVLGAGPALTGVTLMHHALGDDECYSDAERKARRDGRTTSKVAAGGVLLATPSIISSAGGRLDSAPPVAAAAPVAAAGLVGAGVYFGSKTLRRGRAPGGKQTVAEPEADPEGSPGRDLVNGPDETAA